MADHLARPRRRLRQARALAQGGYEREVHQANRAGGEQGWRRRGDPRGRRRRAHHLLRRRPLPLGGSRQEHERALRHLLRRGRAEQPRRARRRGGVRLRRGWRRRGVGHRGRLRGGRWHRRLGLQGPQGAQAGQDSVLRRVHRPSRRVQEGCRGRQGYQHPRAQREPRRRCDPVLDQPPQVHGHPIRYHGAHPRRRDQRGRQN